MAPSLLHTGSFINDSRRTGFWEPHTSSIDFCESNYLHTPYVVEPHNVWSSLVGLSLFGVVGILYGNPLREWRTFLAYATLFAIGLGSAALHTTLDWRYQSFDELPMIYLMIEALYTILEVDAPRGRNKHRHLGKLLVVLACVDTAAYYTFQHLYIIFLFTFSALILMAVYLHIQIAWRMFKWNKRLESTMGDGLERGGKYDNNRVALRFYAWHHVAFTLVASPVWVLDQFHCELLLPAYDALPSIWRGMTLHVMWHACAGLGAHFFIQFLCACRAGALGMTCDTRFVMGIPVVVARSEGGTPLMEVPTKKTPKNQFCSVRGTSGPWLAILCAFLFLAPRARVSFRAQVDEVGKLR